MAEESSDETISKWSVEDVSDGLLPVGELDSPVSENFHVHLYLPTKHIQPIVQVQIHKILVELKLFIHEFFEFPRYVLCFCLILLCRFALDNVYSGLEIYEKSVLELQSLADIGGEIVQSSDGLVCGLEVIDVIECGVAWGSLGEVKVGSVVLVLVLLKGVDEGPEARDLYFEGLCDSGQRVHD